MYAHVDVCELYVVLSSVVFSVVVLVCSLQSPALPCPPYIPVQVQYLLRHRTHRLQLVSVLIIIAGA